MPDPLTIQALRAARYEAADPATITEVEGNQAVAELHRVLAEQSAEARESGAVLPLRACGGR